MNNKFMNQNIILNRISDKSGEQVKLLQLSGVYSCNDANLRFVFTASNNEQRINSGLVLSGSNIKINEQISAYNNHLILSSTKGSWVRVSASLRADYLHLNPVDQTNEGGEIYFEGSPGKVNWTLDNWQNNVRFHAGGNTQFNLNTTGTLSIGVTTASGTLSLQGAIAQVRSLNSDLILSSSATSKITISGTNLGFSTDAIANGSHLTARNSPLILSSSAGSCVVLSGALKVPIGSLDSSISGNLYLGYLLLNKRTDIAGGGINLEGSTGHDTWKIDSYSDLYRVYNATDTAHIELNPTGTFSIGRTLLSGTLELVGAIAQVRALNSDLILSSSATSKITISGTNLGFSRDAIANGSHLAARNSHLVLSSTAGSVVAISSSMIFPDLNKSYHIKSDTAKDLILGNGSLTNSVFISGVLRMNNGNGGGRINLVGAASRQTWTIEAAYETPPDPDPIRDVLRIYAGREGYYEHAAALNSSGTLELGYSTFSGTLSLRGVVAVVKSRDSDLVLSSSATSKITISGTNLGFSTDAITNGSHLVARNSHLILSSSVGSHIAISGSLKLYQLDSAGARVVYGPPVGAGYYGWVQDTFLDNLRFYENNAPYINNLSIIKTGRIALGENPVTTALQTLTVRGQTYSGSIYITSFNNLSCSSYIILENANQLAWRIVNDRALNGGSLMFLRQQLSTQSAIALNGTTGYVGIGPGATNPLKQLDVIDNRASDYAARFFNDGADQNRYGILIQCGADDATGVTKYIECHDGDGGEVGYIQNNNGTFELVDASDENLKTDINYSKINGLEVINNINTYEYKFKKHGKDAKLHKIGFIAQDLEKIFPEAVSSNSEGTKGVSKSSLIPVLVKAIQEQQKQIEELKEKINNMG